MSWIQTRRRAQEAPAGRPMEDTLRRQMAWAAGTEQFQHRDPLYHVTESFQQTFDAIGRRHASADTVRAMELVRAYRFPHVNMDLIAGLPADTPEGFRRSLDKCLELGADDITIHTLALKKGSRILMEGLSIPDGAAVQAMLDYAAPTLRAAGFVPYYLYRQKYMSGSFENVGWSRPGGECWYNVDIMSELCSILSFGAGGSTKMVEPGTNHIERVFNLKYPKEYTERPEKIQQNQAAFAEFYQKYVPET